MEITIEINNSDNKKIVGVLHSPEYSQEIAKTLIIFISPGLKDRSGPHRMYIKLARHLSNHGYHVFRFDPIGIGDSEGELKAGYSVDNFVLIQNGLFVENTIKVISHFKDKLQPGKIILFGLCGGAITAILAGIQIKEIKNFVLLDTPVSIDSLENLDKLHPLELQNLYSTYLRNFFSLKSLFTFITFRSNYKEISRVIAFRMKQIFFEKQWKQSRLGVSQDNYVVQRPLNDKFIKAFLKCKAERRKILFLESDNEKSAWEFKHKFQDRFLFEKNSEDIFQFSYIKTANHEFASMIAQGELLVTITSWLKEQV